MIMEQSVRDLFICPSFMTFQRLWFQLNFGEISCTHLSMRCCIWPNLYLSVLLSRSNIHLLGILGGCHKLIKRFQIFDILRGRCWWAEFGRAHNCLQSVIKLKIWYTKILAVFCKCINIIMLMGEGLSEQALSKSPIFHLLHPFCSFAFLFPFSSSSLFLFSCSVMRHLPEL